MMTKYPILAMLLAIVSLCSCSADKARQNDGKTDSTRIEHIKKISMSNPEKALAMLDSAEHDHSMAEYDINALRVIVYNNSSNQSRLALKYALKAYADTTLARHPKKHLLVTSLLAYHYYQSGIYNQALTTAKEGIRMAREQHNGNEEMRLLMTVAMCQNEVGMMSHAKQTFDSGIAIMRSRVRESSTWRNWIDLVEIYAQKANTLLDSGDYDDVVAMYGDYDKALSNLEDFEKEKIEGSKERMRAVFYAIYSLAFQKTGDGDRAYEMYRLLEQTKTVQTPDGYTYLVPYLMAEHRYGEAIKKLRAEEANFMQRGRDTVDYYFVRTLLPFKATALYNEGYYQEAAQTAMRAVTLCDSLDRKMKHQRATWMSEVFNSEMKDKRLMEQAKNLKINNAVILASLLLLTVLGVLLARVVSYNRTIRRKNLAATQTINELIAYKEQLAFLMKAHNGEPTHKKDESKHEEDDHQMFLKMEQKIISERLFLRPKLSRDDVIAILGISKNRFASLFTMYSGKSFNRYINDMRLDYAAQQLKQNPNYSVEAIAQDCGMPVRQTFYRLFTEKFGITPAEYRKMAQGK